MAVSVDTSSVRLTDIKRVLSKDKPFLAIKTNSGACVIQLLHLWTRLEWSLAKCWVGASLADKCYDQCGVTLGQSRKHQTRVEVEVVGRDEHTSLQHCNRNFTAVKFFMIQAPVNVQRQRQGQLSHIGNLHHKTFHNVNTGLAEISQSVCQQQTLLAYHKMYIYGQEPIFQNNTERCSVQLKLYLNLSDKHASLSWRVVYYYSKFFIVKTATVCTIKPFKGITNYVRQSVCHSHTSLMCAGKVAGSCHCLQTSDQAQIDRL